MKGRYDKAALKQAMKRRGVRSYGIATQLGVSDATVSQKITGKYDWWLWEVQGIAEYLHLTPDEVQRIFFAET